MAVGLILYSPLPLGLAKQLCILILMDALALDQPRVVMEALPQHVLCCARVWWVTVQSSKLLS